MRSKKLCWRITDSSLNESGRTRYFRFMHKYSHFSDLKGKTTKKHNEQIECVLFGITKFFLINVGLCNTLFCFQFIIIFLWLFLVQSFLSSAEISKLLNFKKITSDTSRYTIQFTLQFYSCFRRSCYFFYYVGKLKTKNSIIISNTIYKKTITLEKFYIKCQSHNKCGLFFDILKQKLIIFRKEEDIF